MTNGHCPTSRRAFLAYGTISAGTLASPSRTVAEAESTTPSDGAVNRGAIRPSQFIPKSSFTVLDAALEWRSERLSESYQANVIAYDRAPSYRAFLLTASDKAIEAGQSFDFGAAYGKSSTADDRFATVELERDSRQSSNRTQ